MPLSLNEIKDRALAFSREWEGERAERLEAHFGRGGSRIALTDAERVAFLFELYHKYTSLLPSPEKPKQRRRHMRRLS